MSAIKDAREKVHNLAVVGMEKRAAAEVMEAVDEALLAVHFDACTDRAGREAGRMFNTYCGEGWECSRAKALRATGKEVSDA